MHNLDLHNKMLEIAKQVRELKEEHPDLSGELHRLEEILTEAPEVNRSRPRVSPLYHTSGSDVSESS